MGVTHVGRAVDVPVEHVDVSAYRIPTDTPHESDGTLVWDATTLVLVELQGGGTTGLGYTYADTATAALIRDTLADVITGQDVMGIERIWATLVARIRNLGRSGITAMAISAVDAALWDLKARILNVPLVTLLGTVRDAAPIYGSGGFTSYSVRQLERQLAEWVEAGIPRVKMKVGRDPAADPARVAAARAAIGDAAELFVDANGAYSLKQALACAERFRESGVSWFEEPVYHPRSRGPEALPRVRAGNHGDRRRRVWLQLDQFCTHPRGGSRGCAAGRCLAVRRDHRFSPRRLPV